MSTAISAFRDEILPHVPGCPFFKIDEAILKAIIEFCEDTHILVKGFWVADATATDPGDEFDYYEFNFSFGDDSAASGEVEIDLTEYFTGYDPLVITWFSMDGASYGLYNVQKPVNMAVLDADTFDTGGQPYKAFQFTSSTELNIYPFDVDETHDFFIQIAVKPQKTATSVDDLFYTDWQRAITYLATSNLQDIPDVPWSNEKKSDRNRRKYQGEMGRAKIRVNSGMVRGEHRVSGNYF